MHTTTRICRPTQLLKTVASASTPECLTGGFASSVTASTGTVTFTATSPHNLVSCDRVIIYGASGSVNGEYTVIVTNSTVFTFAIKDSTISGAIGGTISFKRNYLVKDLFVIGVKGSGVANTSTALMGTSPTVQFIPVLSNGTVTLTPPENEFYNLAEWWVRVGSDGDGVGVILSP